MGERFTADHVETWRRDGAALIHDFFKPDEIAAVVADFEIVFGGAERSELAMVAKRDGGPGRFHGAQFKTFEAVPFDCSPALNLIGVHPALVSFAKAALGVEHVHLYQCQAWAKFTGAADYDQPFHCDYANHTLTAPSETAAMNAVTIMCYFTDVDEAHGPMHYVPRGASAKIAGPEATLDYPPRDDLQDRLAAVAVSSASPAGTIAPYGIDIFHRGTNMTAPNGHRYAVMACFKAAGDEAIGYHAWPFHHLKPWHRIFAHATPEQLACFGVPLPGDPFWTETTVARTQARYAGWDAAPYLDALVQAERAGGGAG